MIIDVYSITRSNGSTIQIRSPQGPPPWAGGPNRNREKSSVLNWSERLRRKTTELPLTSSPVPRLEKTGLAGDRWSN